MDKPEIDSVSSEDVTELARRLNSPLPNSMDYATSLEARIRTLHNWVANPLCFKDDATRMQAQELIRWFQ